MKTNILRINLLVLSLIAFLASHAQTPYDGRLTIGSGETFIVEEDYNVFGWMAIADGGTLIIDEGVEFSYFGTPIINGTLEIRSGGGVVGAGSLQTGFGAANTATIIMHENTYFTLTGAWMQYNPTVGEAELKMADNTVVEICGDYQQNRETPYIEYTGTRGKNAYLIIKEKASGNSVVGDDSHIKWISMGDVEDLLPGDAEYCGPFAEEADCNIWPEGLTHDLENCGDAKTIVENLVLPISFLRFDAYKKETQVELKWSTLNEINNRGFYIQQSSDGRNWKDIAFKETKAIDGFSMRTLDYSYTVNNPLTGYNYYRLRQVDYDMEESWSPVRLITFNSTSMTINTYPNPAHDQITVNGLNGKERIEIYNTAGLMMNSLEAKEQETMNVSLENLEKGIYFMRVMSESGEMSNHKIIKQ